MELDELRISRNGGVCFTGRKTEPVRNPVLFVGLGGTGIDALLRMKNEVQSRMLLPKGKDGKITSASPENIAFIGIDTDMASAKKKYGFAGFSETGGDFLSLSAEGSVQAMVEIRDKHLQDEEWRWIDPEILNGSHNSTGQIRQLGRLMLFWNIGRVIQALSGVLNRVGSASKKYGVSHPIVYILAGIGGGTGSGMFLDIAYIIRQIANTFGMPGPQIHGYLFSPDLYAAAGCCRDQLNANGFAALKELDYWMSVSESEDVFDQKYSSWFKVCCRERPFDFCHIITGRRSDGRPVSYSEAMDTVKEHLTACISGGESCYGRYDDAALQQVYDGLWNHIVTVPRAYSANNKYLSAGSGCAEIPYTEIVTLMAARMFEKLHPLLEREPDAESLDRDLMLMDMREKDFLRYITGNVPLNPLILEKYKFKDIWGGENTARQAVVHWVNGPGQALQTIGKNRENLQSVYDGKFMEHILHVMCDSDKGPFYAAHMLQSNSPYSLIRTLEGLKQNCREHMAAFEKRLPELENAVEEAYNSGRKASLFGQAGAAEKYRNALMDWSQEKVTWQAYMALESGLRNLIEQLVTYDREIFRHLTETLYQLMDIFHENKVLILEKEHRAGEYPGSASKYLVTAAEFEKKCAEQLSKRIDEAAGDFLRILTENLRQRTGIERGEAITEFVNGHFGDLIEMNVEDILKDKMPTGENCDEDLSDMLRKLKANSLPLLRMDTGFPEGQARQLSLISVPGDCPWLFHIAEKCCSSNEIIRKSADLSGLRQSVIVGGVPLFAIPEVTVMEKAYKNAMRSENGQGMGIHLKRQWGEELPTPIPEVSWSAEVSPVI